LEQGLPLVDAFEGGEDKFDVVAADAVLGN
jgi:hypothetical protein